MTKQPNQHAIMNKYMPIFAYLWWFNNTVLDVSIHIKSPTKRSMFNGPTVFSGSQRLTHGIFSGITPVEIKTFVAASISISGMHRNQKAADAKPESLATFQPPPSQAAQTQLSLGRCWARISWQVGMSPSSCEAAHPPIFIHFSQAQLCHTLHFRRWCSQLLDIPRNPRLPILSFCKSWSSCCNPWKNSWQQGGSEVPIGRVGSLLILLICSTGFQNHNGTYIKSYFSVMSIDFHRFSMGFPSISIHFKGLPHLAPQLPSSPAPKCPKHRFTRPSSFAWLVSSCSRPWYWTLVFALTCESMWI